MTLPKISIITAVLNCEKYVERAIKSVLGQDYPNLEYIVIDGGSTDGTLGIIDKYKDKISYFVSEPDNGNCEAQNKGVKAATGEYVAYLAGDDWYEEGLLNEIGKKIKENPDVDVVTCAARSMILDEAGNFITIGEYNNGQLELTLKSVLSTPLANSRFYKRDLFDKIGHPNPVNYRGEYFLVNDREFIMRVALSDLKSITTNKLGVTFFGHEDSMTFSGNDDRAYKIFQEYLDIYDEYLKRDDLTNFQKGLIRTHHRKESIRSVWRDIKNKKYSRALGIAKRGFKTSHIFWLTKFLLKPVQMMIKDISRSLRGKQTKKELSRG